MYSGSATYNICDDKIRASFDERLSPDDYKAIRQAGFAYWRGSQLFVAKWSTGAEDKLREFGITEIEDDDAPDDVEARVDRFSGYAENAEQSAESASNYAHDLVAGIPAGQPILVGHHSERGHRATLKRCDAATRRALNESQRAAYWNDRVAASIRHAKYKERPDVIARRIQGLEKDERKYIKELSEKRRVELMARAFVDAQYQAKRNEVEFDKEAFKASYRARWERHTAFYQRWLEHVQMVLAYQRELYKQSGGTVADRKPVEKGGAVKCWASPRGSWSYIQKVNKVTVTVLDNWGNSGPDFTRTIKLTDLKATMTAAEVQAARDTGQLIHVDARSFVLRDAPETMPATETPPETGKEECETLPLLLNV
jgi:hypothetical protein